MGKLGTIWNYFRCHKYLVVTVLFLLVILLLDENSLLRRVINQHEIAALKAEIQMYEEQFQEDTRRLNELDSNPETIEKIARERYLMKRPDEDVFIFED